MIVMFYPPKISLEGLVDQSACPSSNTHKWELYVHIAVVTAW